MKRSMMIMVLLAACSVLVQAEVTTRIKDATRLTGLRSNDLLGYGIVVGLQGTGDSKGTMATIRSIVNMLESFGVRIKENELKGGNVAAVMVTAKLQPFSSAGDRLDVMVSSIGDATSLQGGMLMMTPLKGANGQTYAAAQGSLSLGGFTVSGGSSKVQKGHPTVAMLPGGATVEKDLAEKLFREDMMLKLSLLKPDFTTAVNIAKTLNQWNPETLAKASDAKTVEIYIPLNFKDKEMEFIAQMEQLSFSPDMVARVLVNERTGTIMMGGPIKVLPTAVAHGNLKIEIREQKYISQPNGFSSGTTQEGANTSISVDEGVSGFVPIQPGNTVNDVVRILNTLGVSPRDMILILETMRSAGALQAELEMI